MNLSICLSLCLSLLQSGETGKHVSPSTCDCLYVSLCLSVSQSGETGKHVSPSICLYKCLSLSLCYSQARQASMSLCWWDTPWVQARRPSWLSYWRQTTPAYTATPTVPQEDFSREYSSVGVSLLQHHIEIYLIGSCNLKLLDRTVYW